VLAAEPGEPVVLTDLFVGGRREDEVARGLEALPREGGDRDRRRRDMAFHVERTAAPHAAAAHLARPRIHRPLGRVRDDGVRVGEEQEARAVAAAGKPRD
jgi:hypothetical protein